MAEYGADTIVALEGLEAVYLRPGMYVGSTDKRGFHHLLWEVVDNSVDEAMGGFADRISVTIHEDESVTVTDNGRGIPVEKQKAGTYKGMPTVEMVMTVLHAGGKFEGKNYTFSGGLHGVGISVVNALSTRVEVDVRRGGSIHHIAFAGKKKKVRGQDKYVPGLVDKKLTVTGKTKTKSETGTSIRFWPNMSAFTCDSWDSKLVLTHMRRSAFLNPGLTFVFTDERHGSETLEFCYPNGLADFMAEEAVGRIADADEGATAEQILPHTAITLGGADKDGHGEWSMAMQWFPDERYIPQSFANGVATANGGVHVKGFEEAMTGVLNKYARQDHIALLGERDENLKAQDWRAGCGFVIAVKVLEPKFRGQTKDELDNPEIKAMVKSQFTVQFGQWLASNPAEAKVLVERFVQQMRFRLKMAEIARAEKSKGKQGFAAAKLPLPAKLSDCSKRQGAELFIVEGDSAAGPAIKARDSAFQAVLPVRGKGLNIEKALAGRNPEERISNNAEVQGIIATIGAGSQDMFDLSRVRYEKIVLLMDADPDGRHIAILLLTLFYRLMPQLVEDGRVYVARPPLFGTRVKDKKIYFADDAARDEFLMNNPRHSAEITRFKGLGEMNHGELNETTINPATRSLARVVVEDAELADSTLRSLMGSDRGAKWDILKDAIFDEEDLG